MGMYDNPSKNRMDAGSLAETDSCQARAKSFFKPHLVRSASLSACPQASRPLSAKHEPSTKQSKP